MALATSASANTLYSQAWDGVGNLDASQNDTTGGFGNFATTYDDFTLSQAANVNGIEFVGGYFNPPAQSPISAFTLTFYADAGGAPGAAIATGFFSGTAGETSLGSPGGFPMFDYTINFVNFNMVAGTYWESVVPDIGFPPQWGTGTSASGNGNAYQCFFGSCGVLGGGVNQAFSILGDAAGVPEPASWALMLLGFGGIGSLLRARRRKQAVAAV